jgi:hypothetical protein
VAVVPVHQGAGPTQDTYEEAVRRVSGGKEQVESPSDWPVEGLLAHVAGEAPSGFRVVVPLHDQRHGRRIRLREGELLAASTRRADGAQPSARRRPSGSVPDTRGPD